MKCYEACIVIESFILIIRLLRLIQLIVLMELCCINGVKRQFQQKFAREILTLLMKRSTHPISTCLLLEPNIFLGCKAI